jgi:3-deoxy-D-manno-octulosonate 8-phosphate phosphatase (KDO 8-P phosphatase)
MPSRVPTEIRHRLAPVRLLVLDVDGVLTDGSLFYSGRGEDCKAFSVRDGLAVRLLLGAGIQVAVISGRSSPAVAARCADLGIRSELVVLGSRDKVADLERLEQMLDIVDLEVAAICDLVCGAAGGRGAVREFAELILKVQGKWMDAVGHWVAAGTGSE